MKKQEQLAETEEKGKGLCCATVFRETLKGLTWRIDEHLSYWVVFLCQQQVSCWFGSKELRRCREIGEAIERMERQQQAAVPGTRKLGRNERGGEKRHCNNLSPNQADERWQPQSLGARITILSVCLSSSHTHTHTPQDAGHYAEELAVRPCSHIHFKNTAISAAQYFIAVRDKPDYWPRLDQ